MVSAPFDSAQGALAGEAGYDSVDGSSTMASVYVLHTDGHTELMTPIRCENEDRELQAILENNPNLLPGNQIDPENPRRWILLQREMPVPDPNTGIYRWSIDFVFADQDAIPTFVECKRFGDTRARREVVGQILEYAANGHHYWGKDVLRDFADQTAKKTNVTLEDAVCTLQPSFGESLDLFFEQLEQNLREGQLRLIFFLEQASMELRSVVDFLNKQMERSEVLLVEARQYVWEDTRIVVPILFGYTEQARQVKRSVTVTKAGSRKHWNRTSYFADAEARLAPAEVKILQTLLAQALTLGYEISWGTGSSRGSFNLKEPTVCPRSLLSIYSDGELYFNSHWLNGSETAERVRDRLKSSLMGKVGLEVPTDYTQRSPSYKISEWGTKVLVLVEVLKQVVSKFRANPN